MRWWLLIALCACGRLAFDAQTGDGGGGSGDSATPVADTCIAHAGAVFCEGFEGDLSQWQVVMGSTLQTTAVHGGSQALVSTTGAGPDESFLQHNLSTVIAAGSVYARAWVYVPGPTQPEHMEVLDVNGPVEGIVSLVYRDGILYFGTGSDLKLDGPLIVHDQWFCIEYGIQIANTAGSIELRIDDQVVLSQGNVDTLPNAGYTRTKVGIPYVAPEQLTAATVYTDDVVIDTAPIGCLP